MEERQAGAALRLAGLAVWLGTLLAIGSVVLLVAGSRIGEHRASTYGQAYDDFRASWGGQIDVTPPRFWLERRYVEREPNEALGDWVEVSRVESLDLVPRSVALEVDLAYGERQRGWLRFRTFEARTVERYHVAGHLRSDTWGGRDEVQLTIEDVARA